MKLRILKSSLVAPPLPARGVAAVRVGERAVALVVTLLLLSVITFMAVLFLVVSRNEHGNVATDTDQATAKLAAEGALQRAAVQLAASVMATTNPYAYTLQVPTNYVNIAGFFPGNTYPTNVNYDGATNSTADSLLNLANLLYDPSPPVYILTNSLFTNAYDRRHYLDLNRNGRFDPTGLQPVISPDPANPYYNTNGSTMPNPTAGQTLSNYVVGDPQWIGVLLHPQFAHSATNPFVARYTYIVVPAGQTLDLNSIHNFTKQPLGSIGNADRFFRNQGVLTSEINLAAFLTDLNTNLWPPFGASPPPGYPTSQYSYDPTSLAPNTGAGFEDAVKLLYYRYNSTPYNLATPRALFGNPGGIAFQNPIDVFSQGPLMTNTTWPPAPLANPNPGYVAAPDPWQGSENPQHFASAQDLFDENKTAANLSPAARAGVWTLTKRLQTAATNNDSYNRETFYRLLSQLGTDAGSDPGNKMNLNYVNVDAYGRVVPNMVTNFQSWPPAQFFTNAAIRLLADAGYTVGHPLGATNLLVTNVVNGILVTNLHIPIYPTNYYTPSVHRLLQLAANLYDATTNRLDYANSGFPYLPTVFCPMFYGGGDPQRSVYITGYREANTGDSANLLSTSKLPHDLSDPTDSRPAGDFLPADSVYGIPVVIGAKKGFPNFNKLAAHTAIQVTRKLQFRRSSGSTTLPVSETNQMYLLGISNVFGVEAWNSYATNFPRRLQLVVIPDLQVLVTNETGNMLVNSRVPWPAVSFTTNLNANTWPGYNPSAYPDASFQIPLSTNAVFLQTSTYSRQNQKFIPITGIFETISPAFYVPRWWLTLKTRLRFAIIDVDSSRLVDYVSLADETTENLADDLSEGATCSNPYTPSGTPGSMWCTNQTDPSIPSAGVQNQIAICLGQSPYLDQVDWNSSVNEYPPGMDKNAAIDSFRNQFDLGSLYPHPGGAVFYKSNSFAAPYQPFRNIYLVKNWQANDPLVHYTIGDLQDVIRTNVVWELPDPSVGQLLGAVNRRYEPWGHSSTTAKAGVADPWEIELKDPVARNVGSSDSWDFSTNKFPNPGWIGRVHRGSPWQTVYFKSPVVIRGGVPFAYTNVDFSIWFSWAGNGQIVTNFGQLSPGLVPFYVTPTQPVAPKELPQGAYYDSFLSQPTNDWRLLDLFSTAFSESATKGQLSVNQPGLAAWSAVLSGVVALTNQYDAAGNGALLPMLIQPAGIYDANNTNTWTPIVRIVDALNKARLARPGQAFHHLGDILSVPELTIASPFINNQIPPGGNATVESYVLNDAAYERIPQQIMGLLKLDPSPRFVVIAYGQALKPAQRSVYQKADHYFGMVTNYQIVAETALRAVVRLEGASLAQYGVSTSITNLHPVIEDFSVLRPE
jgi:hypothetical protein